MNAEEIRQAVTGILDSELEPAGKLQAVCDLLRSEGKHYDWVGYYLVDGETENELILGPFSGEPTEHIRIGYGQGICGQAAASLEVFVIDDVNSQSNYLSCSPHVKSEFVAPVIWENVLVGELDLDSHTKAAFGEKDSELLLWIADVTAADVSRAAGLDRH